MWISLYRPFGSCHVINGLSSVASSLEQPMWGWIKNARFSGVKRFRQQKVNMWSYTVSLISYYSYLSLVYAQLIASIYSYIYCLIHFFHFQDNTTSTFYSLGVSRRNSNMPIFLYEMHTYYTYMRNVTVFVKYKPGLPHKSIFKRPKVCSEK